MKLEFSWYCFAVSQLIESGLSFHAAARALLPILPAALSKKIQAYLESSNCGQQTSWDFLVDKKHAYLKQFFFIVDQAALRGTRVAEPLATLSHDLRFEREMLIERKKHNLSTKMLLPMFIFLFPSALIVLLSPLLSYFFQGGFF